MIRAHSRRVLIAVIFLVSAWCSEASAQQGEVPAPLFELRVVHDDPAPDRVPAEFDGDVVHLDAEPLVSDVHLERVRSAVRPGRFLLHIECSPQSAHRFDAIMRQNIGRRVGVLFDSRIRSAPVVRAAVTCAGLDVSFSASPDEAEEFAAMVRQRWPPSRSIHSLCRCSWRGHDRCVHGYARTGPARGPGGMQD